MKGEADIDRDGNGADPRGIDRVNGFSDAVFAVAITILILTITVPAVSDIAQLPSELGAMRSKFVGFVISFLVIGSFWLSHHAMFKYLASLKRGFMWLNLHFLMFIVILPFSTDLMSEYNDSVAAVAFYDINMAVASLTLGALWWYASYLYHLTDKSLDPIMRRRFLLHQITTSFIFLLALGVAFINAPASLYLYFLLIPNELALELTHRRSGSSSAESDH